MRMAADDSEDAAVQRSPQLVRSCRNATSGDEPLPGSISDGTPVANGERLPSLAGGTRRCSRRQSATRGGGGVGMPTGFPLGTTDDASHLCKRTACWAGQRAYLEKAEACVATERKDGLWFHGDVADTLPDVSPSSGALRRLVLRVPTAAAGHMRGRSNVYVGCDDNEESSRKILHAQALHAVVPVVESAWSGG